MDVRTNINELGSHVSSIALYIRSARLENKPAIIAINDFEFQCDFATGAVTRKMKTNPSSGVSEILGKGVSEPYVDVIMRAHSLAAKIDLIEKINGLHDPVLTRIISKHPVDVSSPARLNEQSVNKALIMILGEIKTPFIAKFGFKFSEKSATQEALYAALKVTGIDAIQTYGEVDAIWNRIPREFKSAEYQSASNVSKL